MNTADRRTHQRPWAPARTEQGIYNLLPSCGISRYMAVGYFITRAIREHLGDGRLIGTLGNPVAWIRAYQQAAGMPSCDCPPLSASWLDVLRSGEAENL